MSFLSSERTRRWKKLMKPSRCCASLNRRIPQSAATRFPSLFMLLHFLFATSYKAFVFCVILFNCEHISLAMLSKIDYRAGKNHAVVSACSRQEVWQERQRKEGGNGGSVNYKWQNEINPGKMNQPAVKLQLEFQRSFPLANSRLKIKPKGTINQQHALISRRKPHLLTRQRRTFRHSNYCY